MNTTALLYVHPTVVDHLRVFEIRRLAQELGCTFIRSKPKPKHRESLALFKPNGGGDAA